LRLLSWKATIAAAGVILRIIGGPQAVNRYVSSLGIRGLHLQDDEAAVHRNPELRYSSWPIIRRFSSSTPRFFSNGCGILRTDQRA
jgi:hypothetical protein